MAFQTTLLGAAGEHFVMSELLRRGFIAALAPVGAPNVDIIVTDRDGSRLCSIQVKTRRGLGSDGGWYMHAKHETLKADTLFYCFVDFGEELASQPKVFVMPSAKVAEVLWETHRRWLDMPGRNGQRHEDGSLRRLRPDYTRLCGANTCSYSSGWLDDYRDRWDILKLEPQEVEEESTES